MQDVATNRCEQSSRPVVVYDGECSFCARQIEVMKRRDTDRVFEFVPRQAEGLDRRFPMLVAQDFDSGMRLVHPDTSISVGADAVYHIARRLRGWKLMAWLYRVPGLNVLCRKTYAWIARNRYRLAKKCDDGTCEL